MSTSTRSPLPSLSLSLRTICLSSLSLSLFGGRKLGNNGEFFIAIFAKTMVEQPPVDSLAHLLRLNHTSGPSVQVQRFFSASMSESRGFSHETLISLSNSGSVIFRLFSILRLSPRSVCLSHDFWLLNLFGCFKVSDNDFVTFHHLRVGSF